MTGIPPHVAHMRQIKSVKETCEEIKMELQGMREGLKTIIHEAIDEKVESSGGINTALLDKRLGDMEQRLLEKMDTLENFQSVKPLTCVPLRPNLVDASEEPIVATCNQFFYRGRFWCVPESFCLPRETNRFNGWCMWLQGMIVVSQNVTYCIKPIRLFQGVDFPSKAVKFDFSNKWSLIFSMMELYYDFLLPDVVDDEFVCCSFDLSTDYLKIRASYIWRKAKDQRAVNDYCIGTWSQYVQRSSIEKWGTEEDKALLPALTAWNQTHKTLRTFVINWEGGQIRGEG